MMTNAVDKNNIKKLDFMNVINLAKKLDIDKIKYGLENNINTNNLWDSAQKLKESLGINETLNFINSYFKFK